MFSDLIWKYTSLGWGKSWEQQIITCLGSIFIHEHSVHLVMAVTPLEVITSCRILSPTSIIKINNNPLCGNSQGLQVLLVYFYQFIFRLKLLLIKLHNDKPNFKLHKPLNYIYKRIKWIVEIYYHAGINCTSFEIHLYNPNLTLIHIHFQ